MTFQGRKADVHKTPISASKVHSKGHVAAVDSNGGYIILYNSALARDFNNSSEMRLSKNLGAIRSGEWYTKILFGTLEGSKSDGKRGQGSQLPSCASARNKATNHAT